MTYLIHSDNLIKQTYRRSTTTPTTTNTNNNNDNDCNNNYNKCSVNTSGSNKTNNL